MKDQDDMFKDDFSSLDPHTKVSQLLDAFSTGELEETEQREVEQHIASCAECRLLLKDIHMFHGLLKHAVVDTEASSLVNMATLADAVMAELANSREATIGTKETEINTREQKLFAVRPINGSSAQATSDRPKTPLSGTTVREKRPMSNREANIWHVVNPLAAVLVVGAIIAASLLLFTHHPTPDSGGMPTTTTHEQQEFCHIDVDDGLHYVCLHHLYQDLQLSKKIGKFMMTIEQAYADKSRIVVSFTITEGSQDLTANADLSTLSLIVNRSIHLSPEQGIGRALKGGFAYAFWFSTPSTIEGKTLNLQLRLNGLSFYDRPDQVDTPATFTFSLPLHAGLQLFSVHQSVTVNGLSINLDGGAISLSEVQLYLAYKLPSRSPIVPGSLSLFSGTSNCEGFISSYNPLKAVQVAGVGCHLSDTRGQWTLIIQANPLPNSKHLQPWTFHFSMRGV